MIVTAANVDLNESNLDRIDPKELVAAVSASGTAGSSTAPDVLPDEAQELAQRVWWYLLFAGILLLIAETVLAQRASRAMPSERENRERGRKRAARPNSE